MVLEELQLIISFWDTFATENSHADAATAQAAEKTTRIVDGVKYTVETVLTDGLSFGAPANNSAADVDFTATARGTLGGRCP